MNGRRKILMLTHALLAVMALPCFAQDVQQVQLTLDKYNKTALQEKIYLHSDKDAYVAGETIWFKLYCQDATYNKPLTLSKVAYVDVLDNANVSVMQAKIAMSNGMGSGSLMIPPALTNGNYRLRAYTNWMKNFGPEGFFEKKIAIINTLRAPDIAAKTKRADSDVQFFPEGGYLISGLSNNVAFKAVGAKGKGISFTGAIINDANDTLVRFQPLKFGMGHFVFTPAAGVNYRAVVKIAADKRMIVLLPAARNNGYAMHVTDSGTGTLNVQVNSNTGDQQLYLFAHTRGQAKAMQATVSANGKAVFTLSKDKLGEGVSSLTVFDASRRPVCERLYFKRPKLGLLVDAGADAGQYSTRKKVTVTIAAKNAASKLVNAGLSMAVYRADSLQVAQPEDIATYFWLGADLKGAIESPAYYFASPGAEADEALDNLLLTQGWRRFKWDNILQPNADAFKYLPEYNGHIVVGKATNADKSPAKEVVAYLGVPGKRVQVYTAKSDDDGKLFFNTKEFYGANEIVVQTNTERDTLHRIEVMSPFAEQYSQTSLPEFQLNAATEAALQQQSLGMQVQNVYVGSKLKRYFEPVVDSSGFFGQPYKTYKLDDFTRFVTMDEVVREYVREASVSSSRGRAHITIIGEKTLMTGDPLVMLDGVPVFNIDKVMAIDPLKVQRLQIVRERYFWGPSVQEGIMNYTTYKGDLGGAEMDPHATVIDYEGMQLQREFYSPAYETEEQMKSRIPDFRSLLFWSPDINTGSSTPNKVAFYTSDQPGKYIGVVQGMAPTGDVAAKTFTFEVK